MILCRANGWTGSLARQKNRYGQRVGYLLNHKNKEATSTHQGHGCWTALEPLALQPRNGWAYTLDATPSSYDERSQMWIFGLVCAPCHWVSSKD